jgi:molybdopterin-guanine dinucleotide biosynthesis protein A
VPEGRQAVVFHVVGEASPRPLPIRIAASTAPHVSASLRAGRRALHRLLDELDPQVVTLDAEAADALRNVNTPEEYQMVLRERD